MRYNVRLFAGIFVVLLILVIFVESPWGRGPSAPKILDLSKKIAVQNIDALKLESQKDTVELVKKDGSWFLKKDTLYLPVGEDRLARVIESLTELKGEVVGTNPGDFDLYEVSEDKALKISVYGEEKAMLDLYIGKPGPGFGSTYVREKNQNSVLSVPAYLKGNFSTSPDAWVDRTLTNFQGDSVQKVSFTLKGEKFSLIRKNGSFIRGEDSLSCDSLKVTRYLNMISRISGMALLDTVSYQEGGFETPSLVIEVFLKNGKTQKLIIGKLVENIYYATKGKFVYSLSKSYVENALMKDKEYFLKGET